MRYKLITVCFISLLLTACNEEIDNRNAPPKIDRGKIDLTTWDFAKSGPVKLAGEWEFYWNQQLEPSIFTRSPEECQTGYFNLPGIWNKYQINKQRLGGDGFATFRLRIKMAPTSKRLALGLEPMASAYSLFVNGQRVASNGIAGRTKEDTDPKWSNKLAGFSIQKGVIEIVLWVSNFHIEKGGPWNHIHFGLYEDLRKERYTRLAFDMFLFGALLIMALYHLGLFSKRRKELSNLYFGILCLIVSIRTVLSNERFFSFCYPDFSWFLSLKLEFITMFLAPAVFLLFLKTLFPGNFSGKGTIFVGSLGVSFALVTASTSPKIFTHLLIPFHFVLITLCIYIFIVLLRLAIHGKIEAIWMLCGFTVFLVTILIDILGANQLIFASEWVPFGTFIFIFAQSYILSTRFSNTFSAIESLSGELRQKNVALSKVDELKNEFLANTSHELLTPLHGMLGLAQSVKSHTAIQGDPQSLSNLDMLISTCRRLSNMVNDIQDFSRLKHNKLALNIKPIYLRDSVNIVIHICQHLIGERDLKLVNALPDDLPPVLGDEDRIQQILYNLVGNAVKFTEIGSVTISGKVIDQRVEISVEDTGPGFEIDHLERLFSPFEQAIDENQSYQRGAGLGLAISKKLLEFQGGTINADSVVGKGSVFRFLLPMASSKPEQQSSVSSPQIMAMVDDLATRPKIQADSFVQPGKPRATVLVVDDDLINLRVINNYLSRLDINILRATDGIDALKQIDKYGKPDLILLDVMMPNMSGFEFCDKIREKTPSFELPIIFLTARNQIESLEKGFRIGGNDYLVKPFSQGELVSRVQNQLQLLHARDKLYSLRHLSQSMSGCENSIQLMTLVFQKITHMVQSTQAFLVRDNDVLIESPDNKNSYPGQLSFSDFNALDDLYSDDSKEIQVFDSLKKNDPASRVLQSITNQKLEGSRWLLARAQGFEEFLLIIYRTPENLIFLPDDIGFIENVLLEVENARKNRQKFILDLNEKPDVINIISKLNNILYITAVTREPYVNIIFDNKKAKTITIRTSLQNLQNCFPEEYLLRVHLSYMINPNKVMNDSPCLINRGRRDFNLQLTTRSGSQETIPVARSYQPKLRRLHPNWFPPEN